MSQRVDQGELTPDIIFPYYPYQNIQSTLFLRIKKMDWVAGRLLYMQMRVVSEKSEPNQIWAFL
jgi:hypothetical protein